jgi:hypothetical protein
MRRSCDSFFDSSHQIIPFDALIDSQEFVVIAHQAIGSWAEFFLASGRNICFPLLRTIDLKTDEVHSCWYIRSILNFYSQVFGLFFRHNIKNNWKNRSSWSLQKLLHLLILFNIQLLLRMVLEGSSSCSEDIAGKCFCFRYLVIIEGTTATDCEINFCSWSTCRCNCCFTESDYQFLVKSKKYNFPSSIEWFLPGFASANFDWFPSRVVAVPGVENRGTSVEVSQKSHIFASACLNWYEKRNS